MQPIFAVTLPFFALVLMGYAAAHKRLLPESAIPGLNAFVLYFALPALLFRFGMNTPIGQLLNPVVLGVSLLASLGIVAFTIAVTLSPRVQMKDAAFGALVAAFPNTGFMGVPLLTALLGAAAAGPVICAVLVDLFVTSSVCIALAQAHEAKGQGTRTPPSLYLPVAAIKLFAHPLLVFALAAGAHALGAPIGAFEIMVLTLAAALPSASSVSPLAERYGADNGRIARIILSSTALAFVTFSALAWLFDAGAR
jgi:malonate transporter and related proteins